MQKQDALSEVHPPAAKDTKASRNMTKVLDWLDESADPETMSDMCLSTCPSAEPYDTLSWDSKNGNSSRNESPARSVLQTSNMGNCTLGTGK
ncbi:hypothetical protein ABBQ32_003433 [Trebouxia sp. C0010 RCD-2024]